MRKNLLRLGLATATAIGLSLGTGTAFATPGGPGVQGTIISQTTIGGKDYISGSRSRCNTFCQQA